MKKKTRFKWILTTEIVASVAILAVIIAVPTTVIYSYNEKTASEDTTDDTSEDTTTNNQNEGDTSDTDNEGDSSSKDNDGNTDSEEEDPSVEDEEENEVEPAVYNEDGKYQTYTGSILEFDSPTLLFAGRSNIAGVNIDTANSIANEITPDCTLSNDEIWIYNEDASDEYTNTKNATYSVYDLVIASEDDISYVKNFINISENWYNQTDGGDKQNNQYVSVDLSTELDLDDINYEAWLDWNVTISAVVKTDDSFYQFICTITPKNSSSDTINYQFRLYSQFSYSKYFN